MKGWPFDADLAGIMQDAAVVEGAIERRILLGRRADGTPTEMRLVRIPAGRFVMGSDSDSRDELPLAAVTIDRPFWMSVGEVTNEQFALFDPEHDSRYVDMSGKDHSSRGFPINGPRQPVVRVSWLKANEFCRWIGQESDVRCALPTEAQWEWAARAGSDGDFWFGTADDDFAPFANLADRASQSGRMNPFLRTSRFNDGQSVTSEVGRYKSNAWGLFDMHGNAAEWTRTAYRPYPYDAGDGRDGAGQGGTAEPMVVRGGSWRDRPNRARSAFRQAYPPYQRVHNVGFRIVVEDE